MGFFDMYEDLKNDPYVTRLRNKLLALDIEGKLDFAQIDKAIYWAKKYHSGQMRKSGEPFYTHPLEVAYIISDYLLKTDVIVASILHDIVEDTEVTVEMIKAKFGARIAEAVDRLTRDRPDGTKLSVETVLENAYKNGDKEVLLIKLADRIHNMQTLKAKSSEKVKKTAEDTFIRFISLSIYLGGTISKLCVMEENITELCYQYLSVRSRPKQLCEQVFEDNFRLLPPTFQSDLFLKHKLC